MMHFAKLILVVPTTIVISGMRPFSVLKCLKTRLRSTMHRTRLNWSLIMHVYNEEKDEVDLTAVANQCICVVQLFIL